MSSCHGSVWASTTWTDMVPVLGMDCHRLFEMGRYSAALDLECPAILCRLDEPTLGGEHRLDSEPHSFDESHRLIDWCHAISLIHHLIRYMRFHVKFGADAMSAVAVDHREAVPFGDRFDCLGDVVVRVARLRLLDASFQCFFGALYEAACGGGTVAHQHSRSPIVILTVR